ncbi:MAG: acyloxyacyl hydrolase [Sphingomicrobium sp.]
MRLKTLALLMLMVASASPAAAGELFGGVYAHAVNTPLSLDSGKERGADFQLGFRGGDMFGRLRLQPYAFGAVNSSGGTDYVAVGLSRKFGDRLFIRPGVGLAIHDGSVAKFEVPGRIAFGSRLLFEPELGIGARIAPRLTVEASWVHMSHAQLFGGQNPGIDNIGGRVSLALP